MIKFDVKNRWSGEVQFTAEIDCDENTEKSVKLGLAVQWAITNKTNLSGANLSDADLSGANLSGADLFRVDLSGADLFRAYLSDADLSGANLSGADLFRANLFRADLSGADLFRVDLFRANLSGADLSGADLSCANLSCANLSGADLTRANLSCANLSGANLSGAKLPFFQIPQEGELIVFKKLRGGVAKLLIPSYAKRTASLVGRKCRAEFVKVLDAPSENAVSKRDNKTKYIVGEIVRPDSYDDNPAVECTNGIHFFLTREEAEDY